MPWFYLFLAGLTEIGWAVGLKYTTCWSRLWPSVAMTSRRDLRSVSVRFWKG